jgi:site-specific DNA-cytosine methylase
MNNNDKIILHLCCSEAGSDSAPYKEAGYDVRLIGKNIGVENYHPPKKVYGIIANPPCTEFSFAKSNSKYPRDMREGMRLVKECLRIIWECQYDLPTPLAKRTNLKFWMLENPFGLLRRYLGHPPLVYNPYEYGDPYQKKTCVWGFFNVPKKSPCAEYSKDYIHTISPNGKSLKKFDQLLNKEIQFEGNEHLSRQDRRSLCSPAFAKAFYRANK